jgi:hypothetical protein
MSEEFEMLQSIYGDNLEILNDGRRIKLRIQPHTCDDLVAINCRRRRDHRLRNRPEPPLGCKRSAGSLTRGGSDPATDQPTEIRPLRSLIRSFTGIRNCRVVTLGQHFNNGFCGRLEMHTVIETIISDIVAFPSLYESM